MWNGWKKDCFQDNKGLVYTEFVLILSLGFVQSHFNLLKSIAFSIYFFFFLNCHDCGKQDPWKEVEIASSKHHLFTYIS